MIFAVDNTAKLKDYCIELHPSSTGSIKDKISVRIDYQRYYFNDEGRIYFNKAGNDRFFNVDISNAPTGKYDTSEIASMKSTDFDFYIKKNGKVCVCFGPYMLGFGGWTKSYDIAGRYKK